MDQRYTLELSLLDFVPTLAFLIGAIYLVSLTRPECGRPCATAMAAGTALVYRGGTLKAIWKLLYTVEVGAFVLLSEQ